MTGFGWPSRGRDHQQVDDHAETEQTTHLRRLICLDFGRLDQSVDGLSSIRPNRTAVETADIHLCHFYFWRERVIVKRIYGCSDAVDIVI